MAGSGGGRLGFLLPACLGGGSLLHSDPGIGVAVQFRQGQQVVLAVALGVLPLLAVLVAAAAGDRIAGAVLALVLPDGHFERAVGDLVNRLVALGRLIPGGILG